MGLSRLVDGLGLPVKTVEPGEVVLINLHNRARPMTRHKIHDMAIYLRG